MAALRLKEAKLLLDAGCPDGAYYLAGYAAESALKACIAKRTERHEIPDKRRINDSYTHDFDKLLGAAGLREILKEALGHDADFAANWLTVAKWSSESRYRRPSKSEAEALLNALEDRKHGVLRWLRQHW